MTGEIGAGEVVVVDGAVEEGETRHGM